MASCKGVGFLILFSVCYLFYGMTFAYILGVGRSIQHHFGISEWGLGWLYAAMGIGYAITVTASAYFGGRKYRVQWVSGGFLVVAFGCVVLAISSTMAQLPLVEDPANEVHLWKDAWHRLNNESISTPLNLLKTPLGAKMPDYVQEYLMQIHRYRFPDTTPTSSKGKREVNWNGYVDWRKGDAMLIRTLNRIRREAYGGHADDEEDTSFDSYRRDKRELASWNFPDDLRDKLKEKAEVAVFGFYYLGETYDFFAETLANITRDPEVYSRMMNGARLPFGVCRNATGIVRNRLREEWCRHKPTTGQSAAMVFAFIGFLLIGIGSTTIWTVGIPILDDEFAKSNLPLFIGCVFGLQALSVVIGGAMGLVFQFKVYFKLFSPPADWIKVGPLDPRWVGAWWLGFFIIFISLTVFAIIMIFIVISHKNINISRTPLHENDNHLVRARIGGKSYGRLNTLISSIFDVCRPPIFVALVLAMTFDAVALKGYFDFLPRFFENNYSPMLMGHATHVWLLIYSVGILLGGIIMKFTRLDGRRAAVFIVVCTIAAGFFSLLTSSSSFGCRNVVQQVLDTGIKNPSSGLMDMPTCTGCNCDSAGFFPICNQTTPDNDDNSTNWPEPYYSPCHAGCTVFNHTVHRTGVDFYFDYCFCGPAVRVNMSNVYCKDDCKNPRIGYILFSSLATLLSGFILVPAILFVLRTTTYNLRSLSLGVVGFAVCVFGLLPSGLLYRLVSDSSCFVWRSQCANNSSPKTKCEIYDVGLLRERIHLFLGILRLVSVSFYVLVWYHAKHVKLFAWTSREPLSHEGELTEREQLTDGPFKNDFPKTVKS